MLEDADLGALDVPVRRGSPHVGQGVEVGGQAPVGADLNGEESALCHHAANVDLVVEDHLEVNAAWQPAGTEGGLPSIQKSAGREASAKKAACAKPHQPQASGRLGDRFNQSVQLSESRAAFQGHLVKVRDEVIVVHALHSRVVSAA